MKQSLTILLAALLFTSCTWIKFDPEECPDGFWIQLHYTYNILDVEAAPEYVKDAALYIYDAEGNYVQRIDVTPEELSANGYRVRVDGLPDGDYQFMVWSGINSSLYSLAGDHGPMTEFRLALANQNASSDKQLPDLFYGFLPAVHYDSGYAQHDVYLMKNTNLLACLIMPTSTTTKLNPADFSLSIVSANGEMDANNNLVSDKLRTYEPFVSEKATINDSDYGTVQGVSYSISTLRLMTQTDCRIILKKRDTGNQIFNISLPEYIGMIGSLYTNLGKPLSVQEYLDRQDFYSVVFFLSEDLEQLMQLQVNSWRLRANNHLKI